MFHIKNLVNTSTVLLTWKNKYYISTYISLSYQEKIIKIIAKKISNHMFRQLSEYYPIIALNETIVFDVNDHISHILKLHDTELGRLEFDEIKKIINQISYSNIVFDISNT